MSLLEPISKGKKKRAQTMPVTPRKRLFVLAGAVLGASVAAYYGNAYLPELSKWIAHKVKRETYTDPGFQALGMVGAAVLGAILVATICGLLIDFAEFSIQRWKGMHKGERLTTMLGAFLGILASLPILQVLNSISLPDKPLILVGITLGLMLAVTSMVASVREYFPWERDAAQTKKSGIKILDTNVLIDGRIYDVARAGFLEGELYVPFWVLEELQHIADHHDTLKRQRGRRGLDLLRHMQLDFPVEVGTKDKLVPDNNDPVDTRLVRLAKILGADIVTNDYNLNKVAGIQDVRVLSLNDLTLALRPNVLPQERLNLLISREGKEYGQGVGYLDDGTMVVVENGKPHLGETIDVLVTQVIQTERGKMIFGEVGDDDKKKVEDKPVARRGS